MACTRAWYAPHLWTHAHVHAMRAHDVRAPSHVRCVRTAARDYSQGTGTPRRTWLTGAEQREKAVMHSMASPVKAPTPRRV